MMEAIRLFSLYIILFTIRVYYKPILNSFLFSHYSANNKSIYKTTLFITRKYHDQ